MGNYDFALDLETENTMSVINQWIDAGKTVIEFGPANGRLTQYLSQEKKCCVTIVEIDEQAGLMASDFAENSYLGEEQGDIEKFYWLKEKRKFDYAIFADVLEHLQNPFMTLVKCKEILKPEGKILVSIPNITHNSVIIDLLNDRFEYDEVGLLDKTHVHFFSFESFQKMVYKCDLYIENVVPIYSRVGNNEIKNSYKDVPVEISKFLRKRVHGSIYQYVLKLRVKNGQVQDGKQNKIHLLKIDEHEELEMQCFFKKPGDEKFSNIQRITQKYFEGEIVNFEIENLESIEQIRWDPMEENGIVVLRKSVIFGELDNYPLVIKNTNAVKWNRNIFLFENNDPWIEFEKIPEKYKTGRLFLSFEILEYRKEKEELDKIIYEYDKIGFIDELNFQKVKEQNVVLKQREDEMREYISHLENDIEMCNREINIVLKQREDEMREYISHLENDIRVCNREIQNFQREKNEIADLYCSTIEYKIRCVLKKFMKNS